jgi:hypothetical protein
MGPRRPLPPPQTILCGLGGGQLTVVAAPLRVEVCVRGSGGVHGLVGLSTWVPNGCRVSVFDADESGDSVFGR